MSFTTSYNIHIARVSYYRVFLQWKEWGDPDHEGCAPCNPIQISPLFQPIWYGFCRIVIRPCLFKQTLMCWIMVCSACFFYQSSKVLLLFWSWMVFVWGPHHRQSFSPLILNVLAESLVLNWNGGFSNNYSHLNFFLKFARCTVLINRKANTTCARGATGDIPDCHVQCSESCNALRGAQFEKSGQTYTIEI